MSATAGAGSSGRPGHVVVMDYGGGGDADYFSGTTTATETSPLLQGSRPRGGDSSAGTTTPTNDLASGRDEGGAAANAESHGHDHDHDHDHDAPSPSMAPGRAFALVMSMWALIFLQASNMSGMTMAQSAVAADLDAYDSAMWFTSSYLMTMASLSPLVGKLAAVFSSAVMVVVASAAFALGALVCSQAHSLAVFLTGRVFLGAGAAGIMTLALILVIELTSKRRRGLFIGLINAGFTIGLSSGAVVFGALIPVVGWRALFYLQIPIGLLGGLGVWLSLPARRAAATTTKAGRASEPRTTWQKLAAIDYLGAVTMIATLVLFLYGLSAPTVQWTAIAASLVTLVAFVAVEYRVAADPIIPLSVLRSRGVLLSCLAQLGFMAARWTVLFYAPIFVLAVRGLSPAVAGAVLIPTNLGFGSGGLLVGWLHVRRGGSFWLPCLAALSLFGLGLVAVAATSTAASPAWAYILAIFANGLATGAALNYTLAHLLHLARPGEAQFVAASLLATFRGFAGSFGTAIGGGVFGRSLAAALADGFAALDGDPGRLRPGRRDLITKLVGSPAFVFSGGLSPAERAVAVHAYELSLGSLYRLAAALTVLVVLVQAATGWSAPSAPPEEDATREAFVEADATMEA